MKDHLYKLEIVRTPGWTPGGLYALIYPNQKLNCELNWVILFLLSVFCFLVYFLTFSVPQYTGSIVGGITNKGSHPHYEVTGYS